jgi:hypothetical protein
MAIDVKEQDGGRILQVHVMGRLTRDDYARFVPEVERVIGKHGRIRVLFDMRDFHGWTAGALWEDLKFDLKHFRDIERLALVGERRWEQGMAAFCRPFTTAAIRYFDRADADDAHRWVAEADVAA